MLSGGFGGIKREQESQKETDWSFLLRLCGIWNDLTIAVTFLFCAWALLYTEVVPKWQFPREDEELQNIAWLYMLAAVTTMTALVFEFVSVLVEYSPAEVKEKNTAAANNNEDSKVMMMVYAALSLSYFKMGLKAGEWVHTDPFAFGGPRPVYTMRFLEWSICMPLLLALSGDPIKEEGPGKMELNSEFPADEGDQDSGRSYLVEQVHMIANIPVVAASRLTRMGVAPSARCTVVYIWSSWLALVVEDEFTRWVLLNVSFAAFAVAALEQTLQCYILRGDSRTADMAALLLFQVFLAAFYGVIYLGAVLGFYSWWAEQVAYTVSDVGAKLLHSSFLMSLRRQRNLMQLSNLRKTALAMAADLRRIIRQANVPIFVVNPELEVQDWNFKIAEVTGISREAALNQTLPALVSAEDEMPAWWAAAGALLKDAMEEREPDVVEIHFNTTTDNGSKHSVMAVSASCIRTGSGQIKGAVCIGQDITALTAEKQKAQALAEGLHRLIEDANAPIFQVDLSDNIVEWNTWLVNTTGLSRETVLGKHISSVLSPGSKKRFQDARQNVMSSWHVDCFEVNVVNKDEQTMTLLLTATPCVSLTGKTSGAICIGQDITKLKDLDERKASMMAMVSHELKSPLHGIIGLCSSLMSESSNSERLPKAVETMHNCASRLLDMVANIMDASVLVNNKRMRMTRDPVQMKDIIDEVLSLCQKGTAGHDGSLLKPGVKLVNNVQSPLPIIEADAYRCTQLMYNLVTNAMKFTHDGRITISAGFNHEEQVIFVEVEDTGIGIAPENIKRIFEPFDQEDNTESRQYKGIGLGLSISHEVAAKHGGELIVESQPGSGSTFRVILPYKMMQDSDGEDLNDAPRGQIHGRMPKESMQAKDGIESESTTTLTRRKKKKKGEAVKGVKEDPISKEFPETASRLLTCRSHASTARLPSTSSEAATATHTVLCVDDDQVHLEVMQTLLVSNSFQVDMVFDGIQALQYLETRPLPDLVLLDVMMPHMTGPQVLRAIRRSFSPEELPVIIISAKCVKDNMASYLAMGANDCVMKPFARAELLERIRLHVSLSAQVRSSSMQDTQAQHPTSSATVADAVPDELMDVLGKEMERMRGDRDAAVERAEEMRKRVSELESELDATTRSAKLSEEQLHFLKQCQTRQKAIADHHQWLAKQLSRLEFQQQIQHRLLSARAGMDVGTSSQTSSLTFPGSFAQRAADPYFWRIEKVEAKLMDNLQRMEQLAAKLPDTAKCDLRELVLQLRSETSSLLLEMGQTCHHLAGAEGMLQDQTQQLQRTSLPQLSLAVDPYMTALKLWPASVQLSDGA